MFFYSWFRHTFAPPGSSQTHFPHPLPPISRNLYDRPIIHSLWFISSILFKDQPKEMGERERERERERVRIREREIMRARSSYDLKMISVFFSLSLSYLLTLFLLSFFNVFIEQISFNYTKKKTISRS